MKLSRGKVSKTIKYYNLMKLKKNNYKSFRSMAEIRAVFKSGQDPRTFKWGQVGVTSIKDDAGGETQIKKQNEGKKELKSEKLKPKKSTKKVDNPKSALDTGKNVASISELKEKNGDINENEESEPCSEEIENFNLEKISICFEANLEIYSEAKNFPNDKNIIKPFNTEPDNKQCESDNEISLGNSDEER